MIMRDSPQTQKPETAEFRLKHQLALGLLSARTERGVELLDMDKS